ncbi:MAG: hypothetical protein F4Z77_09865 [Dehalococcoidia bacterium]|nr:hypothetical protein [Dehalococcoidia bacterium]MYA53012.1 hypothetical protein [Dehalococcoidia bacterium]
MTKGNRKGGPEEAGIPAGTPEGAEQVNGQEQPTAGESKSPEQLRHERLVALLREVAETRGKVKAAEALGVSFRTLARAVESGRLTGRMADALERHLREVKGSVTPAPESEPDQADGLEARVKQLEVEMVELRTRVGTIQGVVGALQEDQAQTLGQWERRLSRVEARQVTANGSGVVTSPGVKGASEGASERSEVKRPRRPYPQLVTVEPEGGEELIYGEAMPAINEWRGARRMLEEARRRLDKLDARQRMLELELRLVGDHELTLPPAAYPWDRADRRDEVWRRKQSIEDLQVERNRALMWRWVRRVLTLGLWWK